MALAWGVHGFTASGAVAGFLALLALGGPAFAEEAILSYDSKIVVGADGVLDVTETIRVRAEGNRIRRGIYRDFPTDYRLPNGASVSTTFDVVDVAMNGGGVNWVTERIGNGTRVRIGSADVFLSPGEYTYTIRYKTGRQLYHGEGFDELYFNVTGNGWDFPINAASATVTIPDGTLVSETRAFTGAQGATGQDFRSQHLSERRVLFETTGRLGPRQGLTVVVIWPEGFVARPTAQEKATNFLIDNLGILVGYAGFFIIVAYFYFTWREVGKDPDTGPVIAMYEPPKGLSPGAVSYVKKRAYRSAAFTAAIVNMAVKGYLTIKEKSKTKFILQKTGSPAPLSEGEKAIAGALFGDFRNEIETHHTNHKKFSKAQTAQSKVLKTSHEGIHFTRNQKHFWIGAGISMVFVVLSFLASAAETGFGVFMLLGMALFFGIFALVMSKRAGAVGPSGLMKGGIKIFAIVGVVLVQIIGTVGALAFQHFYLLVPFAMIVITNIVFFNLLEKPTLEGARLLHEIEGFKKYLSIAEKERLEFHTPEITPETFEAYLPFAIALGVENKWGKAFEAQMKKAGLDPNAYHPTWYHGSRYYGFGSRSFASNFGGAMAGAVVAASAPPSTGGSGGGGFSGGGGGGGGGGGW